MKLVSQFTKNYCSNLPHDDFLTISDYSTKKFDLFKRVLVRLAPLVLLTSIILTACNSGMGQNVGEAIDDAGFQYATAISATYAADRPPPFTYYADVHEALDLNGFGKNVTALANLGLSYPDNLKEGLILTGAIQRAIEVAKSPELNTSNIKLQQATDLGLSVFLALGLIIFGPSISSSLYLLLILLTVSAFMFLVAFWNRAFDLIALSATLTGCLIWTTFVSKDSENYDLLTIVGQRSIVILAIVPALYLALVAVPTERPSALTTIFTVFQALILSFTISLRSSISWLILVVFLLVVYFSSSRARRDVTHINAQHRAIWSATPVIIFCSLLGLNSLISILKFVSSRIFNYDKYGASYSLPLTPQLAPYVLILVVCISVVLLLIVKAHRSSRHSFHAGTGKLAVVIAISLFLPQIVLNLLTPLQYYSDDVLPHHMRNHGALLGLTISKEPEQFFPELIMERQDIVLQDKLAYAISFIEYESTLTDKAYVPDPKESWEDRAKKQGFFSSITSTWKMRTQDYYAGKAFRRIAQENPIEVAKTYPLKLVKWKTIIRDSILRTDLQAHIINVLAAFLIFGILAGKRANKNLTRIIFKPFLATSSLFVASFLPLVWTYPAIHAMTDNIIFLLTIILMSTFTLGILIFKTFTKILRLAHS